MRVPCLFAGLAISAATSLHAASCKHPPGEHTLSARSGGTATAVAELYTAEGCDSCPPADKWFSGISPRRAGVVPLAFHVDYWDAGGWADRFARPAYSRRQQESVLRLGSRTVFTPQIMINGQEIRFNTPDKQRGSIESRFNSRVSSISARAPRADLTLDATVLSDRIEATLSVALPAPDDRRDTAAFLAITENNLVSRITAGENGGTTLYHDHVVRDLVGPVPIAATAGSPIVITRRLALAADWKPDDLSVVAFIQNQATGDIYQALSAPVCGKP